MDLKIKTLIEEQQPGLLTNKALLNYVLKAYDDAVFQVEDFFINQYRISHGGIFEYDLQEFIADRGDLCFFHAFCYQFTTDALVNPTPIPFKVTLINAGSDSGDIGYLTIGHMSQFGMADIRDFAGNILLRLTDVPVEGQQAILIVVVGLKKSV